MSISLLQVEPNRLIGLNVSISPTLPDEQLKLRNFRILDNFMNVSVFLIQTLRVLANGRPHIEGRIIRKVNV